MGLSENVVAPSGKSLNADEVALLANAFQEWQSSSDENGSISTLQDYYDRVWLADRGVVTYPKLDMSDSASASDTSENTTHTGCHMFAKYDTVTAAIADYAELSTLAAAIESAGLSDVLRGTGPFTVFAPANAAFAALPSGTVPSATNDLRDFLLHHMAGREISSMDLAPGTKVTTLDDTELSIGLANHSSRTVDGARFLNADIFAKNGVVHIIDTVLVRGLPTANPVRRSVPMLERIQASPNGMPALVPLSSKAMPSLVPLSEGRSRPQRKVPDLVPLRSKEMPRLVTTSAESARRAIPDLVRITPSARLVSGRKPMPALVAFSDRAGTAAKPMPMPALVSIASLRDTAQVPQASRRARSAQTLRPASSLGTYVAASTLPRAEDFANTGTPTLTVASVRFAVRELRRSFLAESACEGTCSVDAFVSELHSAAVTLCCSSSAQGRRTPRAFALLDATRMEVVAEDSEQSDRFIACAGIVTAALRDNEGSSAVRQVIATEMGGPDAADLVGIQRPVSFISNMTQAWSRLVVEAVKGAPIPSTASTEYASAVHVFDGTVNKLLTFRRKLSDSQIGERLEFLAEAAYAIMISSLPKWFQDVDNAGRIVLIRDKLEPMRTGGNGTSGFSAKIGRSLLTATTLEGKLAIGFKNIMRDSLTLRGKTAFDNMYRQVNAFVVAAMKKYRPSGSVVVDGENKQAEFLSFAAGMYLMERVYQSDLSRDRRAEGRVNVDVEAIFRDRLNPFSQS